MNSNKKISNALGIDEEEIVVEEEDVEVVINDDQLFLPSPEKSVPSIIQTDEREDYKKTRKSLKTLLDQGESALEGLLQHAEALNSEDDKLTSRAYEVVAKLMQVQGEVAEKLYNVHKRVKDTIPSEIQSHHINVDKAIFVGTPADMLRSLKEEDDRK